MSHSCADALMMNDSLCVFGITAVCYRWCGSHLYPPVPWCNSPVRPAHSSQQLGDDSINCLINLRLCGRARLSLKPLSHIQSIFNWKTINISCWEILKRSTQGPLKGIKRARENGRESTWSSKCEHSHRFILENQSTCLTVITLSSQSDCSASSALGWINRKWCDHV